MFVRHWHYSGKVVSNSQVHFGCFLGDNLHGVLSYGPPIIKKALIGLVAGTGWNEFLELNRMVFDPFLPKNSESRAIGITMRMIRKQAPHIKWVVSFADATQCGDGTIYRASGFVLTQIKKNNNILRDQNGQVFAMISRTKGKHVLKTSGSAKTPEGAVVLPGFQLRYIFLIEKTAKLTVPIIPFSKIDELGAGMYRGKKISIIERQNNTRGKHKINASAVQVEEGGVIPTTTLQEK